MQPTSGGGLARFRSTPANWLESVLLKEEEEEEESETEDPFTFTQLLSSPSTLFASHYDYPPPSSHANTITQEPHPVANAQEDDSVPCRVRAKRGCATHPRSIAERLRRTRISDRIRKLQELVPNMDKVSSHLLLATHVLNNFLLSALQYRTSVSNLNINGIAHITG
ncbi:hypothetical protein RJT34_31399 [Clitoria ternatea]|uniref:Uncharacterized protein n=1 Tax=Clitoria ternatea TaxID=43366 RepID=A0AAN9EUL3_CLITE